MATCRPGYEWALNAQGQDPCAVATQLRAACNPADPFPPISYLDPYKYPKTDDMCGCSLPVYGLVSACADCQGIDHPSWDDWSSACTPRYYTFPLAAPVGTTIPEWATRADALSPTFNRTAAQAIAQPTPVGSISISQPTITPTTSQTILPTSSNTTTSDTPPVQTSMLSSTTAMLLGSMAAGYSSDAVQSNTAFGAPGASPSAANTDQISSPQSAIGKNSNRGAVIGGATVGVIVLIILVGLLAWWLVRRRRSRMAPSTAYMAQYGSLRPPTSMSVRPLGDRSNSLLDVISHGRSDSTGPYHDEEVRENPYSVGRQEPRYTHLPRSSSPQVAP